LILFNSSFNIS